MMNVTIKMLLCIASMISLFGAIPGGAEPLKVGFNNRPPFHVAEPGSPLPHGTLANIAIKAIQDAGIDTVYLPMEANRIIALIKSDAPFCALGWFKNEERLQFAKFSHGIVRDVPFAVVVKKSNESLFKEFATVAEVFATPQITFGTRTNISYGRYLDSLRQEAKLQTIEENNTQVNMVKMLDVDRFHFLILLPVEIPTLFLDARVDLAKYSILHFSDIPQGDVRRIMCNRAVPDETILRIDKALEQLVPTDVLE